MKNQIKILGAVVALVMAGQVSAATNWTLTGTPSGVTISAFANTGGTNNSTNAANNGALQTIQNASWNTSYAGIANADSCASGSYCDVNEGNSPEHAIDNNQRYDMALLNFASSVKLTDLKLGWASGDSDVTVMAYTGAGAPTLIGKTYNQLVGLGWASIGNYSDLGTTTAKAINAGGVYSSYWLIGAYNPLANPGGGAVTGSASDYVKLASVSGVTQQVPEPASLALFGLALLGMLTVRKQQKI